MIKALYIFICTALLCFGTVGQTCTAPGQNPSTAFPVCGTSTFKQASVPLCGGRTVFSPVCNTNLLSDRNPFWYKFTCYQAGTLGFVITPSNLSDDYDWQLFDITGHDFSDVYANDKSIVIGCNWSGESGVTGTSSAGNSLYTCEGYGKPLFSQMPTLQVGHNYLLLVSHWTQSQSGYSLSFQGGTAVITDAIAPKLKSAEASCGGDVIRVKISKNIKCSSISTAGSEFYITPSAVAIQSGVGMGCVSGFDSDSLILTMSQPLDPGNYTLRIKNGSDGNTLLDYCDNSLATTDSINFTVFPKTPSGIDSLIPLKCAPDQIQIVLQKPVLCSSIAANGSDFTISGNYPVAISGAVGSCNGGQTTKQILVNLAKPLKQAGTFKIALVRGSDGNTIVNECGVETPTGTTISFSIKDTVNAAFNYQVKYGCVKDTVAFTHPGLNNVNTWQWSFDENLNSNEQNPEVTYGVFKEKLVTLTVSNGFCSDSTNRKINLDNFLKADFSFFEDNCPNEPITFTSKAVGKIADHSWTFGDGGTAGIAVPAHTYVAPQKQTVYNVSYTVTDSFGCKSTATKKINIYASCYLAVPTAFTPNGDGLNDYLRPLNAIKAEQLEYSIYNRWGQLLFKTSDWKRGWDGRYNGVAQSAGTYIWSLKYTNRETHEQVQQKGTVVLIR